MVFGPKCCRSHSSATPESMPTVSVDGRLGNDTVKSLQIMLKAASVPRVGPTDGWMGKRTTRAFQTFLWAQSLNPGPVDGWWGKRTIKGMQQWLTAAGHYQGEIDGEASPATISALQQQLNAMADSGLPASYEKLAYAETTAELDKVEDAIKAMLPAFSAAAVAASDALQAGIAEFARQPTVKATLVATGTAAVAAGQASKAMLAATGDAAVAAGNAFEAGMAKALVVEEPTGEKQVGVAA